MWRIANGAMLPGMIGDPVQSSVIKSSRFAFVHATTRPVRLMTQAANAGQDVGTSSILLESACYQESVDVISFFVLHRRVPHA